MAFLGLPGRSEDLSVLSASPGPRWQLHMPIPTFLGVIVAAKGQVSLLSTTVLVQTSVGRVLLL